jgi:hypothetical protein
MVRLEGLGKLKKSGDLIGNRIRYLSVCSIVPQNVQINAVELCTLWQLTVSVIYSSNICFVLN